VPRRASPRHAPSGDDRANGDCDFHVLPAGRLSATIALYFVEPETRRGVVSPEGVERLIANRLGEAGLRSITGLPDIELFSDRLSPSPVCVGKFTHY